MSIFWIGTIVFFIGSLIRYVCFTKLKKGPGKNEKLLRIFNYVGIALLVIGFIMSIIACIEA